MSMMLKPVVEQVGQIGIHFAFSLVQCSHRKMIRFNLEKDCECLMEFRQDLHSPLEVRPHEMGVLLLWVARVVLDKLPCEVEEGGSPCVHDLLLSSERIFESIGQREYLPLSCF